MYLTLELQLEIQLCEKHKSSLILSFDNQTETVCFKHISYNK